MPHQKIIDNKMNKGREATCSSLNHQLNRLNMLAIPATISEANMIFFIVETGAALRYFQKSVLFILRMDKKIFKLQTPLVSFIKK